MIKCLHFIQAGGASQAENRTNESLYTGHHRPFWSLRGRSNNQCAVAKKKNNCQKHAMSDLGAFEGEGCKTAAVGCLEHMKVLC